MREQKQKYRDFQRLFTHVQTLQELNSELRNGHPCVKRLTEEEVTDEAGKLNERRLMVNFWKETIDLYFDFPRSVLEGNDGVVNDIRRIRKKLKRNHSEVLESVTACQEEGDVTLEERKIGRQLRRQDSVVPGSKNSNPDTVKNKEFKGLQMTRLRKAQEPASDDMSEPDTEGNFDKRIGHNSRSRSKQAKKSPNSALISTTDNEIKDHKTEVETENLLAIKRRQKMIQCMVLQNKLLRTNKRKQFKQLIKKIRKRKLEERKTYKSMFLEKKLPKLQNHTKNDNKCEKTTKLRETSCERSLQAQDSKSKLESEAFLLFYSYKLLIEQTFEQIRESIDYLKFTDKSVILKFEYCLCKKDIILNRKCAVFEFLDQFTRCLEKRGGLELTCHHCRQPVVEGKYTVCSNSDKDGVGGMRGCGKYRRDMTPTRNKSVRRTSSRKGTKVKNVVNFQSLISYSKAKKCNRVYCADCLHKHYDDMVTDGRRMTCPYCLNTCFCPRCQNRRSIVKLTESGVLKSQKIALPYINFPNLIISYLEANLIADTTSEDTGLLGQLRFWLQFDTNPHCSQLLSLTSILDAIDETSTIGKQAVYSVIKL